MLTFYGVADAGCPPAVAPDIMARRDGNCAMMRVRSAPSKSIQRAISSSERPQPTQSPSAGWTTQTRVQGVSIGVSTLAMLALGGESRGTLNGKRANASV
jgi:hypothetical protein